MRSAEGIAAGPLTAMLDRISGAGGTFGRIDVSAHPGVPDEPGWTTVVNLTGGPALLEDLMSRIERGCGAENRAYAGTALLRSYLWRALTPAVATMLTERRLPDLRAENVALRFGEGGFAEDVAFIGPRFATLPDDPEAAHPDAVVLPSEEAMLDLLSETLAQTHLPAMVSALRGLRVRRGTRVLWRAAADVCAEAFMYVGQSMDREELALGFGEKLLSGPHLPGSADYYRFEHDSGSEMTRVRGTCCLYYKVADGACFTCPRTTREERLQKMAVG